jgi:hypothetical protein
MAGMLGMFGFGIPDPYWLFSTVLGAFLIYYSQKESKRLFQKRVDTGYNKEPRRKQRGISEGRLKLTTKAAASGGELDPKD